MRRGRQALRRNSQLPATIARSLTSDLHRILRRLQRAHPDGQHGSRPSARPVRTWPWPPDCSAAVRALARAPGGRGQALPRLESARPRCGAGGLGGRGPSVATMSPQPLTLAAAGCSGPQPCSGHRWASSAARAINGSKSIAANSEQLRVIDLDQRQLLASPLRDAGTATTPTSLVSGCGHNERG
jgi:hypothetical protein